MLESLFPESWKQCFEAEAGKEYFRKLDEFITEEYRAGVVFPPREQLFRAFELCAPDEVKVVIVGQDPYHGESQANGLSFSVASGVKFPPSLRNIFKEVADCGYTSEPESGELERWASQGVLLINSVLSVRASAAASHASKGWEDFTSAALSYLNAKKSGVVYMLWGSYAQKKAAMVDKTANLVLESVHPSPLSAYRGWFGSRHFALANDYLKAYNEKIIW